MGYCIWKSYKFDSDPYDIFQILKGERHCFFLDSCAKHNSLYRKLNKRLPDTTVGGIGGLQAIPQGVTAEKMQRKGAFLERQRGDNPYGPRPFLKGRGGQDSARGDSRVPILLNGYSFLGYDPFDIIRPLKDNPFLSLREVLNRYAISPCKGMPPFLGGAVGFLGYDLGFILERKVQRIPKDDIGIGDYFLGLYDVVICIDHKRNTLTIFSCGFPETKPHLTRIRAKERLRQVMRMLSRINTPKKRYDNAEKETPAVEISSNFTHKEYLRAIKKAKEYIKKGDIYQVNLSQRFTARSSLAGHTIYKNLRFLSPASFSAYLDCGDFQIISSSPERFLNVRGNIVHTRPMKGTRPRSPDKHKDSILKKELLCSPKDKAELIMIVDLERNDLGRVCEYGSVRVRILRQIEQYKTVFQTTATVEGILHKNKDRIDLLKACFPGGSITGCPKIRSMQIIEELEPTRRSIYTGSLGYLSFCGNMDLNILIRTILKKGSTLYFQAGGGIVADSEPEKEYEETLVKAKAMFEAIKEI